MEIKVTNTVDEDDIFGMSENTNLEQQIITEKAKDGNDMLNQLDKKENENDTNIIPSNGLNRILNRNKKNLLIKKNNQTYDSVTIKSKSSINFFSKNISKTVKLIW